MNKNLHPVKYREAVISAKLKLFNQGKSLLLNLLLDLRQEVFDKK